LGEYTTIQGDMWDSISKKLYGTEKHIKELMEANTSYLSTLIFSDGIVLNVPAIATEEEIINLPPWRQ
jgi:phage tail protein X